MTVYVSTLIQLDMKPINLEAVIVVVLCLDNIELLFQFRGRRSVQKTISRPVGVAKLGEPSKSS